MSEKALKFGNVIAITKEFHTYKKLIALNLIDIVKNGKKIVVCDKLKGSDKDLKFFIGHTDYNIIRPCFTSNEWIHEVF